MLAGIRIVSLLFYFLVANALLILLCLVRPFHRNNVYAAGQVYGVMARIVGLKVKLIVPDSVRKGGPFVYIANHQNSYDLITVCMSAQPGVVTVGKKSLVWIPVFGWLYWLSGNILIDRNNRGKARDTIAQTVNKIKERGLSVFLFPEGTRSYGRGLLPFKAGAFRIAEQTNEPVVTVCASNLHNKVKLNRWNNGTVLIELSDPEKLPEAGSSKQCAEYFHAKMQQRIQELDRQVAELDG